MHSHKIPQWGRSTFNHSEKENYIAYSIYKDDGDICYSELLLRAAVQGKLRKWCKCCSECLIQAKTKQNSYKRSQIRSSVHYKFKQGSNGSEILYT